MGGLIKGDSLRHRVGGLTIGDSLRHREYVVS